MLEIILVVVISKKIAAMLKAKGRSCAGYVTLFVILWFGGEIFGLIFGLILGELRNINAPGNDEFLGFAYLFALMGAAIGGTTGYLIALMMPPVETPDYLRLDEFDDDEYGQGAERRRRRRYRGDDGSYEEAPGR